MVVETSVVVVETSVVVVVSGGVVVVGILCIPLNDNSYCTFHPHPLFQPLGFPQQVAALKRYNPAGKYKSIFD